MLSLQTISSQTSDIITLDKPTTNLDIQIIEILANTINQYKGALIVISHDVYFLKHINIERTFVLE